MSLDDRLRDGLHRAAEPISPDVDDRLARTQTTFRRHRTARRAALAGALVLVGVAVLTLGPLLLDRLTNASRELPGTSTLTDEQAAALVQGVWVTPVVTQQQATDVLAESGLGEFADTVITEEAYPTAWTMVLSGSQRTYAVLASSGVKFDEGDWSIHGSTLTLVPSFCRVVKEGAWQDQDCTLDFRWQVSDDTLTLELLHDEGPVVDGIPDEAYARALYTTVPFSRR